MNKILDPTFFNRPTVAVTQDLLGKYLVRRVDSFEYTYQINEVEAYDGPLDLACHGRRPQTPRTAPLFGPPGHFYVYLVYGMHWLLNVVTGPEGYPSGVLIRGAGEIVGPARLTKALAVAGEFTGVLSHPDNGLWVEDRGIIVQPSEMRATPRIGIDYAGEEWAAKLWRFQYFNSGKTF